MPDATERFEMQANFEGLVQLLARNLYSSSDAFVRELVQNAHDAIRLREQRQPGFGGGRIEIEARPGARELVFRDNGLGMSRRDIRQFLSVIGSSGTGQAEARLGELGAETAEALIGRFGIGILSAFLVAERVEVRTRKLGARRGFAWENEGSASCVLRTTAFGGTGTEITLRVAPAYVGLLERESLVRALVRYSDFIPYPILLDGAGPVNTMHAPWHRSVWTSEEQRERELRLFVESRYPDLPLEIIPVDLREPVRARGVLFITQNRVPDFNSAGVVDVYVRRMFVRARDPDVLPPWAKFVRGVIDSPDLQPNSARDNVRRDDEIFTPLRQALGELVLTRLKRLAESDPERMAKLCKWHHFHLKGIALFDDDFFDRVGELLFFESNRGPVGLRDLLDAPRSLDGGGGVPIYYVASEGAAAQYYRMVEDRDWTILDAAKPLDEALLRKYAERRPERVALVRLDGEDHPDLFAPLAPGEGEAFRRLEMTVESALRRQGLGTYVVHVRRFAPASTPAIVLATPETEADYQLEALAEVPWLAPEMADLTRRVARERIRPVRLLLNAEHPLVQELRGAADHGEAPETVCAGLALTALLHSRKLLTDRTVPILERHLIALMSETARGMAPQPALPGFAGSSA